MAAEHNGEVVSRDDYVAPMKGMGEAGQDTIDNIRPTKEKKPAKKFDVRMTIPKIYPISVDDLAKILPRNGPKRHFEILSALSKIDKPFADTIRSYKCIQASESNSPNSYKKHITDVVAAANRNQPYAVDIKPDRKSENVWECFIDSKENRLCFIVWKGSD
jgi:hypothetical protein